LLFIIYIVNLHVVRSRSCRVIYYFDTPTLGRRHQSFGRVKHHDIFHSFILIKFNITPFITYLSK
jgi:hypothetical protein